MSLEEAEDDVALPRLSEELSETRCSDKRDGYLGNGMVESWVEVEQGLVEHVASHDRTFMPAYKNQTEK